MCLSKALAALAMRCLQDRNDDHDGGSSAGSGESITGEGDPLKDKVEDKVDEEKQPDQLPRRIRKNSAGCLEIDRPEVSLQGGGRWVVLRHEFRRRLPLLFT
jgi:hypothetical protein